MQLIPPQPSLHSHDLPSSRRRRWSPSASESHSVSRSDQSTRGREEGQRRTRMKTIDTAPSRGTFTLAIIRITVPVLATCKDGEEAVEAWRAFSFIRGIIGSASICNRSEADLVVLTNSANAYINTTLNSRSRKEDSRKVMRKWYNTCRRSSSRKHSVPWLKKEEEGERRVAS